MTKIFTSTMPGNACLFGHGKFVFLGKWREVLKFVNLIVKIVNHMTNLVR